MRILLRLMWMLMVLAALAIPAAPAVLHIGLITGASARVALSCGVTRAAWIQLLAPSGNMATSRVGDITTSSTVGFPLAAGAGFFLPPPGNDSYVVGNIYAYVATGDTLSVTCAD